ncbi:MAG: hypothetical protein AB1705_16615 [Verrucomicrobiota bacterium]
MNSPRALLCLGTTLAALTLLVFAHSPSATAAGKSGSARDFFKNAQQGNPDLKSAGRISFGPHGLLLVADTRAASVVAIDTSDVGPVAKLKKRIDNVDALLAASLGAPANGIQITDLAVNPASGKIYFSILRQADKRPAILIINADGKVSDLDLKNVAYVRVPLPTGENSQARNITDLAFARDRIVVAGSSNEEFANKIFSIPLPLTHSVAGRFASAETYHVSHRKWETKAPISSFIPYEENGKSYVVGAFACTPIAKFPLDDLQPGAQIKGTSVVELGSGNRPLDMFTYEKGGKRWVVTNTQRFKENLFGPSKYWGVRVDMNYLAVNEPDKVNEKAARRDVKNAKGPEGIEVVEALFGAVQVGKLSDTEMVVLREAGENGHSLEVAQLP